MTAGRPPAAGTSSPPPRTVHHQTDLAHLLDRLPVAAFQLARSIGGAWSLPYAGRELRRLLMLGDAVPDAAALRERVHADDRERLRQQLVLSGESGRPWKARFRVQRPDGRQLWLEANAAPQVAFGGGTLWHGVLGEVTDEHRRDFELHELQARWAAAAAAAGLGVVEVDLGAQPGLALEGAGVLLDALACGHHGLPPAEHLRLPLDDWLQCFVEADRIVAHGALTSQPIDGFADSLLLRRRALGGREAATLEFTLCGGATPQRRVGTCRDVTQQQTLEALRRDTLAAEKAGRNQAEFLSRVSHELHTPLNGVIGFAQLMAGDAEQPLPPAQRGRLAVLQQSAGRLLELIEQLLDVAAAGPQPGQPQQLDATPLIERRLAALTPLAQSLNVALAGEIDAATPPLRADPRTVELLVDTLLSNAIRYNRPGGRVRLRWHAVADKAVLVVDDTGAGIDAAHLAALFEPFNRLGADRGPVHGAGLGLAVARKRVQAIGGTLQAFSEVGRGSRFVAMLPLARPPGRPPAPAAGADTESASTFGRDGWADEPAAPATDAATGALTGAGAAAGAPASAGRQAAKVVLYIEDDEVNTILMQQIFVSLPDCRLVTAASGAEGLVAAVEHAPSLILLDLNMPGMTGYDVLLRLKADPRTRDIRCIALSAESLPEQIRHALAAGFDDYWTKPVDVADILTRLREESRSLDAAAPG